MEKLEILERIELGENSVTEFKEKINKELAKEFVAFSNSKGGNIFFGVNDNGDIIGLSEADRIKIKEFISNIAQNITPFIEIQFQNVKIDDKFLIIVEIPEGDTKPYCTSKGVFYKRQGESSVNISREEIIRLIRNSQNSNLFRDEQIIKHSNINDLDIKQCKEYLKLVNIRIYSALEQGDIEIVKCLNDVAILRDNYLTLAGNLIFANNPQKFTPLFYIDCIYFIGADISSQKFLSEKKCLGNLSCIFEASLNFIKSFLKSEQVEENFNGNGELEIKEEVLLEVLINAIVHRDYCINSTIKIFMFDDRIEVINPGKLTNHLTIDNIKNGISIVRNPIINSISKYVLPYKGLGTGIKRVLSLQDNVEFINDIEKEEFKVIIPRTVK